VRGCGKERQSVEVGVVTEGKGECGALGRVLG